MKFINQESEQKTPKILDIAIDEAYLNKKIIENIFKYFLVSIGIFITAILTYFIFFKSLSPSNDFIWAIFLMQTVFYVVGRYLPHARLFAFISLIIMSFALGLTLMPVLTQVNQEFGREFIGKALLACCLLFAGCSIIGWQNESFMSRFFHLIKYACLFLLFFAVISPFINWTNRMELVFSLSSLTFIGLVTVFDFQKIRYYPMRASLNASIHLFSDLFILFIFLIRLFSSLYRA
ncbi:Bax inhibitor-1 family protein [Patescibacteria group bacterium]|nr:Bax inhibitor-1 family protein [Patescibacteria group bacterium]